MEVSIGYIGGKTIPVGSWGFSLMRVFTDYPAGNQNDWYKVALEGRMQGAVD